MSLDLDVAWQSHASTRGRSGEPTAFTLELACTLNEPVTGVFGPSGAGKSTLLALIAGLEHPDRGRICLDGSVLFDSAYRTNAPTHQRRIGVVFQEGRLFPHLSVEGNLRYGHRADSSQALSLERVVNLLALETFVARDVRTLSGGERQRVALGRALLSNPRLLLLDEPLASLDLSLKRQVLPFLRQVAETTGIPMIYVSHDIREILQLTQELLVIENGRRVGQGPFHQVIRDPHVFELAAQLGLENVLRAKVLAHLPDSGLTKLQVVTSTPETQGVILLAPPLQRPVGSEVTIAIRPEDIAVSLEPITGISIQNQIRATVIQTTQVAGRGLLEVNLGEKLLVEVSLRSMSALNITTGKPLCCLFKAHAVRYLDA